MPSVVVLMSSYNGERYIREQIDSILAQVGNFQLSLIVRDDGSTDNTKKILEEYAQKALLKWYSGENLGPAQSFIDLLYYSKGKFDYYAFSDQDDVWDTFKISKALIKLSGHDEKPGLYFSNAKIVNQDLKVIRNAVYKQRPRIDFYTITCACGALGCTTVVNKNLVDIILSHLRPKNIIMHDAFVLELVSSLRGDIFYDQEATMLYRQHENNVVGVGYGGIVNKFRSRFNDINTKMPIGIADQAQQLLDLYLDLFDQESINWLNKISKYQKSLLSRISLALSGKTHYINNNMGLKIRIKILLGNR